MARSLARIEAEIAKLQKEAKAIRAKEAQAVIANIRELIAQYELTPADLFDAASPRRPRRAATTVVTGRRARGARGARNSAQAQAQVASVAKFTDGNGKTWSGKGKRPNWYKDAIAAGKTPEDLMVKVERAGG
jgi:DNA-binding protein H-NS